MTSPPAWRLRPLQEENLTAFAALYAAVFPEKNITREKLTVLCPIPISTPRATATQTPDGPRETPAKVWLLTPAGSSHDPIGFLYFWVVPGIFEVIDIGVHPGWRRRGAASFLLSELVKTARAETRAVHLETRASNTAAIALYENSGFIRDGVRPRYYGGKEDALLYSWTSPKN